ncbi:MAG: OPT/YSL family transporter [Phycisphaerales bacterium]|nr:OPT/YSL family transporter [Phycisphaerales bacterium]
MSDDTRAATPAANDDQIYVPAAGESQLTVRAVLTGCALGAVIASMNIYFGLRTGWSIGGSLIAAILGFAVWNTLRTFFGVRPYSVLETNITQTAGSAAGSMTSTAGLLAAIPALGLLGVDLSYFELTLWALAVAYLGVFFAVPLRNQMVVVEKLRFPTGTATANTIVSMFANGAEALAQARALLGMGIAAGALTLLAYFVPVVGHLPGAWFGIAGLWGFSLLISPLMTGAGILIGPRIGASLLAGAIVSWGIVGPYVGRQGWVAGDDASIMSYATGPRGWILWPGVAIMVADALTQLALSWKTILATFRRRGASAEALGMEDASESVPNSWWLTGLALGSTATVLVSWYVFDIPPWMSVIAIAMSSVLAMIAVRSTGETDINPIGGMGKVTQLVFGGITTAQGQVAAQAMTTNLMAAGITGAGASQAGDMMQDLKTGRMLGASPRKQVIAQCVGITAGILVCVPIYMLFKTAGEADPNFAIGTSTNVPAPAAQAWKAMAEVLSKGFDAMPTNAIWGVVAGGVFGILMAIANKSVSPRTRRFMPSGLAFGIAFIVPAYYSIAMFLGSMLLVVWHRMSPKHCAVFAIAVASGLIAGEGLMGVVTAILTLFGIQGG